MSCREDEKGHSPSKKRKHNNDGNSDSEEEEYIDIGDESDNEVIDMGEGNDRPVTEPAGNSPKWARPPLPDINPATEKVSFQQIDLDYYTGSHMPGMPGATEGSVPIIRIYGVTTEGNSVLAHIHGFTPYFFTEAPLGFRQQDCDRFKTLLNSRTLDHLRSKNKLPADVTRVVTAVDYVIKESIYGYQGNRKKPFLKITVALPWLIKPCQRVLNEGLHGSGYETFIFCLYESTFNFEIRFMIDTNVVGCNWIELPAGKYSIRSRTNVPNSTSYVARSCCQLEVDISWKDFISHSAEGEWSKVAPIRILSFDVLCGGRKGVFPDAKHDSVIQIANKVIQQGDSDPFIHNVFTLKSCAPVVGSQVLSYESESSLLQEWASFFREVDPDIITGFNIQKFDLPYLVSRAKHLKVSDFAYLGRIKHAMSVVSGSKIENGIKIKGRIQFDLLKFLQDNYKLRSYSLSAVSYHFFKEQKEELQHSVIAGLQGGNEQTRHRLAVYCIKNATLPLRLLEKLMCVINYMEMARVTGVPLTFLLSRGQSVKVVSQILRKAKEQDLLLPDCKSNKNSSYEGGEILEPDRKLYHVPIVTLDFASLYPSIMIAHNLCYTALLTPSTIQKEGLTRDQYTETPSGDFFCKSTVRKGLLPEILEHLLAARKKAKLDMKNETDPLKLKVLDGRQLALKLSANSVYGFTGSQSGALPCVNISRSVTAFGRTMIKASKIYVEEHYTKANGYKHDAKIIYGDTDSIMCNFGVETVEEAMTLGKDAAHLITAKFSHPFCMEFERIFCPYLLVSKKRYAGLSWTNSKHYDKIECRGIETVRRDNPPIVAHLLNRCLHLLLIDRNCQGAIEHAQQIISDMLCNSIDISQLIITKELSKKDEAYTGKQVHVELANRMQSRDPGSAPKHGDRISYVIVAAAKGTAAHQKSEDPVYVLENNLSIDTHYYVDKFLVSPLLRIFAPILGEEEAKCIFHTGEHTRTKTAVKTQAGPLSAFVVKKFACVGCKTPVHENEAVCQHCKPIESQLYQKEISQVQALEEKYSGLWTQCQRCQGSLHKDVLCTNQDCQIFYMRKKLQKEMENEDKLITRFKDLFW